MTEIILEKIIRIRITLRNKKLNGGAFAIFIIFSFMLYGCKGSQVTSSSTGSEENNGIIKFSGLTWKIKESNAPVGPGSNYFSGNKQNVWVDNAGRLHMKISLNNGIWKCAEIYTEKPVAYGTYVFYLSSRVDSLDPNAVLGLFTWNDNSGMSDANSEIDIEISRWADPAAKNLHYSVQPVYGPDVSSGFYSERNYQKYMQLADNYSTHTFTWTDSVVSFASYLGIGVPTQNEIANWKYLNTNPPRRTFIDGALSNSIYIPKPGEQTTMHLNLWLTSGNKEYNRAPLYNKNVEVVIDKVEYVPGNK